MGKDQYGKLWSRLQFGIIVREPVSRTHSDFHFNVATAMNPCVEGRTFSELVNLKINGYDGCNLFHHNRYGDHIDMWLEHFHPSQFTIIPWKMFLASGGKVVTHMW